MTTEQLTFDYSFMKGVASAISALNSVEKIEQTIGDDELSDFISDLINGVLPSLPSPQLFWEVYEAIPSGYSGEDEVTLMVKKNDDEDVTSFSIISPETLVTDKVWL